MPIVFAVLLFAAPDAQTLEALENGQFEIAQQRMMKKRASGVWDMNDQLTLAAVCLGKGDLDCAEYLYQETLTPVPRTALAYFGLAEVARLRGAFKSAAKYYRAYLESSLPGRSAPFDQVATQRAQAIAAGATAGPAPRRRSLARPPKFGELSWASSRWAVISFFPALFGGLIAGGIVSEMQSDGDFSIPTAVVGLGVGAAIFGGGVAWGINRTAARRGYTGATLQAAASAVATPLVIGVAGVLAMGVLRMDDELIGPAMLLGMGAGVSLVPAWIYMGDLRPIGAEAGSGNSEGGVPSVVAQ
jgi:hypothetical protein